MKKTVLLLLAASMAVQLHAYQNPGSYQLGGMIEKADLVFKGEVIRIDYRDSEPTADQGALPHTFVTFQVREVLHGTTPDDTVTLRFLGGQNAAGNVMFVEGQPMFDIGDEDVLFVSGNGSLECPLVSCSEGRIRIIEGMAYGDDGRSIRMSQNGAISRGAEKDLEAVNTFRIGSQVYRRNRGGNQSQDDGATTPPTGSGKTLSQHLDSHAFQSVLRQKMRSQMPNDPRGARKVSRSVDRNAPFEKTPAKRGKPQGHTGKSEMMKVTNAADREELQAVRRNGGNPVLSR